MIPEPILLGNRERTFRSKKPRLDWEEEEGEEEEEEEVEMVMPTPGQDLEVLPSFSPFLTQPGKARSDPLLSKKGISKKGMKRPFSPPTLPDQTNVLPTQTILDRILQGGLRSGTITELVGAASVGKTQFALSILASVLSTSHVALIVSGGQGVQRRLVRRLSQILTARFGSVSSSQEEEEDGGGAKSGLFRMRASQSVKEEKPTVRQLLERVHLIPCPHWELVQVVLDQLDELVRRQNVGLVVLDTVPELIDELEIPSVASRIERARRLAFLAARLKRVAKGELLCYV